MARTIRRPRASAAGSQRSEHGQRRRVGVADRQGVAPPARQPLGLVELAQDRVRGRDCCPGTRRARRAGCPAALPGHRRRDSGEVRLSTKLRPRRRTSCSTSSMRLGVGGRAAAHVVVHARSPAARGRTPRSRRRWSSAGSRPTRIAFGPGSARADRLHRQVQEDLVAARPCGRGQRRAGRRRRAGTTGSPARQLDRAARQRRRRAQIVDDDARASGAPAEAGGCWRAGSTGVMVRAVVSGAPWRAASSTTRGGWRLGASPGSSACATATGAGAGRRRRGPAGAAAAATASGACGVAAARAGGSGARTRLPVAAHQRQDEARARRTGWAPRARASSASCRLLRRGTPMRPQHRDRCGIRWPADGGPVSARHDHSRGDHQQRDQQRGCAAARHGARRRHAAARPRGSSRAPPSPRARPRELKLPTLRPS